jgi:hypothetical protein
MYCIVNLSNAKGVIIMTVEISIKEFKKLYGKMNNRELAKHYGVSYPTIVNRAKKLGLSRRTASKFVFVD